MNKSIEPIYNGIIKENPIFVLMLGMCPALAITKTAVNGLGMGITTAAVLICSNLFISILKDVISQRIRIPAYIVIIASFVTIAQLILQANFPFVYNALGIYIPLIATNCIVLGRAEAFASKNSPFLSIMDGIGIGAGFTIALTIIGIVRELLGSGMIFGRYIMPEGFQPISIFIMAPGAFFVLAVIAALQNKFTLPSQNKKGAEKA